MDSNYARCRTVARRCSGSAATRTPPKAVAHNLRCARNPPFVHPFQSMYLEVDDLAQETTFCPQELPMTTSCNAQQCGQKLFEIAFEYFKVMWFLGGKTLFLVLSHIFLSTYFERDGQGVDCRAAQVVHYRFERCRFSSGAELCHCWAAGVVTVHPWKCSFINISAPLWSRTYCLLGYIKLKMITESNRVLKSRHLKIKSAIVVQNPSAICKKTGNCTEYIFRRDCNAWSFYFLFHKNTFSLMHQVCT